MNSMFNATLTKCLYALLHNRTNYSIFDIEYLIENGADVNYVEPFKKYDCIYGAYSTDNMDIVKLLLKHGAKDHDNNTLEMTVRTDKLELFKLLIEYGSDPSQIKHFGELLHGNIFEYFKNYTVQKKFLTKFPLLYKELNYPYYSHGDGLWFSKFKASDEYQRISFLHPKIKKEFQHLEHAEKLGFL